MLASMPAASFTDWFQLGPPIQERLRDTSQALGLVDVGELAPLAEAVSAVKDGEVIKAILPLVPRAPAAFVGYDTDLTLWDSEGGGQAYFQRWHVVLAVKNAADTARNAAVLADAGPLIFKTVQSLSGWRPPIQCMGELRHVAGPRPSFGPGIGLFPLAFLVPIYLSGVNL